MGILNLFLGKTVIGVLFTISAIVYGLTIFTNISKIARLEISEDQVFIKQDFFLRPQIINWDHIERISFGNYFVAFERSKNRSHVVKIRSKDADISLAIKEAVAQAANAKGIEVTPG